MARTRSGNPNGSPPTAPTPWIQPQDHSTGHCVQSNGANVVMISPVGWGIHLGDVNLALGNLVDLVRSQSRAYLKARDRAKRRSSRS